MKVVVLGGGVVGITTAYFLHKNGCDVTVIDRNNASASACSFANGGQLSYCKAEPLASVSSLKNAIKWLGRNDAPLLFRLFPEEKISQNIHMWRWALHFLSNCRSSKMRSNFLSALQLGLYSRDVMHDILHDFSAENVNIDFSYQKNGKFFVFFDEDKFSDFVDISKVQAQNGGEYRILSQKQYLDIEPSLHHISPKIKGVVYNPMDETGDAHSFAQGLEEYLRNRGVNFLYNVDVKNISAEGNKITHIDTNNGALEFDSYVVAMGAYSALLLRKIGINPMTYPLKGYTISIDVGANNANNNILKNSITIVEEKTVYSRLGNIFRAAGKAEFAGYNDVVDEYHINILKNLVRKNFPHCGDVDNASKWACLRSCTPSDVPLIGATKYDNLYLNIGHGFLGWTQAAGSSKLVTDIILGNKTGIDSGCYEIN